MEPRAYCLHSKFDVAGPVSFRVDKHYFVHALAGVMRLEADGYRWTLPPARAALIAANHKVEINIVSPVTSASVLFDPDFMAPKNNLVVFDVSPLCSELVRVGRNWGAADVQSDYARQIFRMLASEITLLEESPSPTVLRTPRNTALANAIELTEARLSDHLVFEEIAQSVGCSPRTLARRFSEEMGLTWRETLRRLRITRAMEALATSDIAVTQISLSVGYESLSAFNSAFREIVGMAPSAYRKSLYD